MGALDPKNPLFLGFSVLRGGSRPWSRKGPDHGVGVDPETVTDERLEGGYQAASDRGAADQQHHGWLNQTADACATRALESDAVDSHDDSATLWNLDGQNRQSPIASVQRTQFRTRRIGANPEKSDLVNFRGPDRKKFSELCVLLFFPRQN